MLRKEQEQKLQREERQRKKNEEYSRRMAALREIESRMPPLAPPAGAPSYSIDPFTGNRVPVTYTPSELTLDQRLKRAEDFVRQESLMENRDKLAAAKEQTEKIKAAVAAGRPFTADDLGHQPTYYSMMAAAAPPASAAAAAAAAASPASAAAAAAAPTASGGDLTDEEYQLIEKIRAHSLANDWIRRRPYEQALLEARKELTDPVVRKVFSEEENITYSLVKNGMPIEKAYETAQEQALANARARLNGANAAATAGPALPNPLSYAAYLARGEKSAFPGVNPAPQGSVLAGDVLANMPNRHLLSAAQGPVKYSRAQQAEAKAYQLEAEKAFNEINKLTARNPNSNNYYENKLNELQRGSQQQMHHLASTLGYPTGPNIENMMPLMMRELSERLNESPTRYVPLRKRKSVYEKVLGNFAPGKFDPYNFQEQE